MSFFPFGLYLLWIVVICCYVVYQDYAIETPLKKLSEGDSFFEVAINLNLESSVAALNFVLKVLLLLTFVTKLIVGLALVVHLFGTVCVPGRRNWGVVSAQRERL